MKSGAEKRVELQQRDYALLRGLFESRVMTLAQAAALFFGDKKEMAKKRVQKLKKARLIHERPRRHAADPSVLNLTPKAFSILTEAGELAIYPAISPFEMKKRAHVSDLKLPHEVQVIDVKVAFTKAIGRLQAFQLAEFSTWPRLYDFKSCDPTGQHVATQPDAFIRVHQSLADGSRKEHAFFVEVDRSQEVLEILARRAHCYGDYYRSGGYAIRCGGLRERYSEYGFRVLYICKSAARRDNIALRLLENTPPVHGHVWLSTIAEFLADPLNPIWLRPIDYRGIKIGVPPVRHQLFADEKRATPRRIAQELST